MNIYERILIFLPAIIFAIFQKYDVAAMLMIYAQLCVIGAKIGSNSTEQRRPYGRNAEHYLFTDRDSSICDLDVYKNGKSLGYFDMTKQDAEDYCKKQTQETGMKHDWHYFAGRVHILYLDGDKNGTTD